MKRTKNHYKGWRKALASAAPVLASCSMAQAQQTGPSSSQSPYLLPSDSHFTTTSVLTVGDTIGGYKMAGIPDGLGAFDNGNGTFTVLMNHELGNTVGAVRDHGSKGAFVSEWVINKSDFSVVSGRDLIQTVKTWDNNTSSFVTGTSAFARFCSADLAPTSAFFNPSSGLGTSERIFMNGEENGADGRAFGHIVTGAEAGISYQLPRLGKNSWENSLANPFAQDKTIVMQQDDTTPGQLFMYVGTKQSTGSTIDKAGLNNGKLFGVKVGVGAPQTEARNTAFGASPVSFSMVDLGNVAGKTGNQIDSDAAALGVSNFLRPEDGAWNPLQPSDYFFVTTDRYDQVKDGVGAQVGRSRLWKMSFADILNPENGGTLSVVLDGTGAGNMFDNLSVGTDGVITLQEDVGGVSHNGKVYRYDIASGTMVEALHHDTSRFGDIGIAASAPYTNDEESSGVIDISDIIGGNKRTLLLDVQAHYPTGDATTVEGGQLVIVEAVPETTTVIPAGLFAAAIAAAAYRRRQARA